MIVLLFNRNLLKSIKSKSLNKSIFTFPSPRCVGAKSKHLSIVLLSEPSNGTINIDGLSGTYTPFANVNGFDSVDFQITDGIDLSEIYQIVITITSVNDAPVLNNLLDHLHFVHLFHLYFHFLL